MKKLLAAFMIATIALSTSAYASTTSEPAPEIELYPSTIDDIEFGTPGTWYEFPHEGYTVFYPTADNPTSMIVAYLTDETSLSYEDSILVQTAVNTTQALDKYYIEDKFMLGDRPLRDYFFYTKMNDIEYAVMGYIIPVDKGRVFSVEERAQSDAGFTCTDELKAIASSVKLSDGTAVGSIDDAKVIKE